MFVHIESERPECITMKPTIFYSIPHKHHTRDVLGVNMILNLIFRESKNNQEELQGCGDLKFRFVVVWHSATIKIRKSS